jgi:hypothetical protein
MNLHPIDALLARGWVLKSWDDRYSGGITVAMGPYDRSVEIIHALRPLTRIILRVHV